MLDKIKKSKAIQALDSLIIDSGNTDTNFSLLLEKLNPPEKALFISYLSTKTNKDILIISGGAREDDLIENISYFDRNVLEFPSWETLPDENITPSPDIIGARFSALKKIISNKENKIVLSPLQSTLQKTISKDSLKKKILNYKKNDVVSFSNLPNMLDDLGYIRCSVVADKGEYAIRGGILDIYSPSGTAPYRIEFFEDTIESIRKFNAVSQKTIEKIDKAFICPANELNINGENSEAKKTLHKRPLNKGTLLLDYLSKDTIIIFDNMLSIEDVYVTLKKLINNKSSSLLTIEEFFERIENNPKIFFTKDPVEKLFEVIKENIADSRIFQNISFDFLNKTIKTTKWIHPFFQLEDYLSFETIEKDEIDIFDQIDNLSKLNIPIIFLNETKKEQDIIKERIQERGIEINSNFSFEKGYLSSAFIISDIPLAYIPYSEFTHKKKIRRQKFRSSYHTPAAEFHHLTIGDLVVHFHSGIGKYLGTEKSTNHLGKEDEFLIIEYNNQSKLFVPLSQAYLVSKYIGAKDEKPQLSTLGSNKWQKTKDLAQKQIIGYASDLIHLYAERSEEIGYSFKEDSEEMHLFEMEFPYEETADQLNAIEEIKRDMNSKKPMERLICGDVGYGKTEVAMRSAFKAVSDGKKQVAVLVPTTVLASQHYESFKDRMSAFPVNIELLSRFNKPKKNKEVIEKAKNGEVDILIGTHRILSKDVLFKNLGLIVIDEEQRFGVRAKEHLKGLKKHVDSLTLSATPIPRTLYMSLINIRDMSIINTPPQDRLPIKTIIAANEDTVIQNAILRELSREGQIFFIHNRVESIFQRAAHIQKLVPHAKVIVAHGQMTADAVDSIFHTFKCGDADILITTTIVENGIDIPNANTILIDNSDAFGLADLYQLRGRVGRWNRAAYAYLLVKKNKTLTEIAQKRLHALMETGGYGGGMKLAMRDLEIRGAGDVLGAKQSGQVSTIGFHLYCKLLKRALTSLKNKSPVDFIETKMEFKFPASIPEYYISETNLRMEIYHRLGEVYSHAEIDSLTEELVDRYGKPPVETQWLLSLAKIRVFANSNQIILIKFGNLTFSATQKKGKKIITKTIILPKAHQTDPEGIEVYTLWQLKQNFICDKIDI